MLVWRLFPGPFRSTAFYGSRRPVWGQRWNHLGVAMVYTATSRALAALEFFVNLEPNEAPDDLLIVQIAGSKPFRYDERMFR
jgi:RES domain-containing protein